MEHRNCIDWADTSVKKFSVFTDDVESIAPNFIVWAKQSASRMTSNDPSVDQETRVLYFVAEATNAMCPHRYMKFKTINSNEKRLDSSYYNHLLYMISLDVELLEEIGKL